jgi:hypothetical protein
MTDTNDVKEEFTRLFDELTTEIGAGFQVEAEELAEYAAGRSAHLATLVGDPDFNLAIRAERDAVTLKAGIGAVQQADKIDQRVIGAIQGGLSLAARLLSLA